MDEAPLLQNGDTINVTVNGETTRYVIESGALGPGEVPLYRVPEWHLTCRRIEDSDG